MPRPNQLRVNEIFHSIQGEGTRAGLRCGFVRLTGCHVRCTYCDTRHAFYDGDWLTLDAILQRLRSFECDFVEITGGEPLLQPNVYPLMDRLLDEFQTVALETSGVLAIERVDPRVVRLVDVKTPSSGKTDRNHWPNMELLTPRDEVKFVIGGREDYDWSCAVVARHDLAARCTVLFTPVSARGDEDGPPASALDPQQLAEWVLQDHLAVRVGLQIHKLIWPPERRGV